MSVTLTSSWLCASGWLAANRWSRALAVAVVGGALCASLQPPVPPAGAAEHGETMRFASPEAALRQGVTAAAAGEPDLAIPALRYASKEGSFHARYYLARVLSIGSGPHVNHGEAFEIFRDIVRQHRTIDPFYDYRAPFVARSALHMALYYQSGIPDADVPKNPALARRILAYAAPYFDDAHCQYELGRMLVHGIGGPVDTAGGVHHLMQAARKGHVAAQAELANILWSGPDTVRDPIRALVLISLALETAPDADEIWIAEQHHQMFCSLSVAHRREALGVVSRWRDGELPQVAVPEVIADDEQRAGADRRFSFQARRVCADGMRMDGEVAEDAPVAAAPPADPPLTSLENYFLVMEPDVAGQASEGVHLETFTTAPLPEEGTRMGLTGSPKAPTIGASSLGTMGPEAPGRAE